MAAPHNAPTVLDKEQRRRWYRVELFNKLTVECPRPKRNRTHIFSERSVSPKTLGCLLGLNRLVSYFRNVVKLSLEVA
ncbi:uncharacterized protein LOC126589164 isoform X3 [Malus sylvestris]|uniref:uncharacterized protein LOC126589164 isoform X3 n=1 Tax=Malus sylvestris TaxID=3752 RepID=UPI0021AD34A0|nr:uncharacterized protein LOC126589164 isoform X3 [Malus sylvestris]